jgi:hypothetical protein
VPLNDDGYEPCFVAVLPPLAANMSADVIDKIRRIECEKRVGACNHGRLCDPTVHDRSDAKAIAPSVGKIQCNGLELRQYGRPVQLSLLGMKSNFPQAETCCLLLC